MEDRFTGKYPISVASNLTGVPEHRLRSFEEVGLLEPHRTEGGTRLYSDDDVELIRKIAELADKGINYAGIREVLEITGGETTLEGQEENNGEEDQQAPQKED